MTDVAKIAASLSPYLRSAVVNLSAEWREIDLRQIRVEELRPHGLIEAAYASHRCRRKFRLIPLGLAVRDLLQAEREGGQKS